MSASLNRLAADKAGQFEEALVLHEIDNALVAYINGLADRGHFETASRRPLVVPAMSLMKRAASVPWFLGSPIPINGRDGSDALTEAKDIMLQRGSTPRVYRNMLVFIAAEQRQLDGVKEAQRATLAWK